MTALQTIQTENQNKVSTSLLGSHEYRTFPHGGSREDEVREICEGMQDILSACFSMPGKEIRSLERCRNEVSRVRQIGMYVTHVVVGLTMLEVGKGFQRDRSTVAHACHVIEDLRDDPAFERIIHMVERLAEVAFLRNER